MPACQHGPVPAGDRVVTDPLCKPFSMGRNLFCVHSRKRLDDIPEMKAAKVQQNRRTLIAMGTKFLQARLEGIVPLSVAAADTLWGPHHVSPRSACSNSIWKSSAPVHLVATSLPALENPMRALGS